MVDAPRDDEDLAAGAHAGDPCITCGHLGADHVERDIEIPGQTLRRCYCEVCDAICEFVPETEPEG